MNHPEQMNALAAAACAVEPRPVDAAALLIDAAAMLACEAGPGTLDELIDRLRRSHATLKLAHDAVAVIGKAATREQ
jgi:hypothetical protein